MARGSLRIYLGASPGVGKTYAMLNEGYRRRERGADVVIGFLETHGRTQTAEQIRDLEIVPRATVDYRGTALEEMDLDAVLARNPEVVLVDEFAHTNVPGSRNKKRWQDVETILEHGIHVISTLNIQHLESLNDVISRITGTVQRETVPDAIVRTADQVELVDMSPEAIRRRLSHGNIYAPEKIDAALTNYFRPGNLGALRELALLWLADRVEESLANYLDDQGITEAWETRERVIVGITGAPGGEAIIRRAARIAGRAGGELVGVHVISGDGLHGETGALLDDQRRLVVELGGRAHEVIGAAPAEALLTFARAEKATQIVLGSSRRSRWHELIHGSFVGKVARLADGVDVHVISRRDQLSDGVRRSERWGPSIVDRRRLAVAWALTIFGLPLLTMGALAFGPDIALATELLLFLALVLAIAAIGGRLVAAVAAVTASLLANWYFVEPVRTLTIAAGENVVSLVVFLAVAITVGTLVDVASRRALDARKARTEAGALARSAATLAADPEPLPGLLEQLRVTFELTSVRLDERRDEQWSTIATAPSNLASDGSVGGANPAAVTIPIGHVDDRHRIELTGRKLSADDQYVFHALLDQLVVAIDARRLAIDAQEVATLTTMDGVRTALLRAVSHDLRSPLASIKAVISGLLDPTAHWQPDQTRDALQVVDEETDRLNRLVGNLLDASRLQIGALAATLTATDLGEVAHAAVQSLGRTVDSVVIDVPEEIPLVIADGALLERTLANLISNSTRHGGSRPPLVSAARIGDRVHLCVIDHGAGIPVEMRGDAVAPFHRLGDQRASGEGVGLGLSIAQGFVDAMGGTMGFDDTPGGGLTVTISLDVATSEALAGPPEAIIADAAETIHGGVGEDSSPPSGPTSPTSSV